jgi:ribosome-binding protein aMBF1 (putative translation factor)
MRRYAPVMGEKTADEAARELLLTTTSDREAHAVAVQALLARNASSRRNDELIAEELLSDPGFRDEWVRTALARTVAVAIARYRGDRDMSQQELAQRLGMTQPQIMRLELGEINPSIDMLMRISAQLGIEFTIDVRPAGVPVRNLTKRAQSKALVGSISTGDVELLVVVG